MLHEIVKEVLDIAAEILDLTIRNERKHRRAAVRTFVEFPAVAGEG